MRHCATCGAVRTTEIPEATYYCCRIPRGQSGMKIASRHGTCDGRRFVSAMVHIAQPMPMSSRWPASVLCISPRPPRKWTHRQRAVARNGPVGAAWVRIGRSIGIDTQMEGAGCPRIGRFLFIDTIKQTIRYDRIRYDTIRYSTIQSVQQKQQDLQSSSSSSQTASCSSSSSVWNPHPHVTLLIGPKPLTFTLSSLYSLLHQLHFLQGHSAQQSMSAHQLVSSSTMSSLYWS